jgi:hypothetical protein
LNRIDRELVRDRAATDAILTDYHVPLLPLPHGTARSGSSRPAAQTP